MKWVPSLTLAGDEEPLPQGHLFRCLALPSPADLPIGVRSRSKRVPHFWGHPCRGTKVVAPLSDLIRAGMEGASRHPYALGGTLRLGGRG